MIQFNLNSYRPYCYPLSTNMPQADYNIDQNQLPSNSSNSSNSSGGGCCCSNNCVGNGKNINQITNLIRSPPLLLPPQSSSSSSLQRQELKQSKRMVLKSSFPKHILYYRIIGPLTMLMIIVSILILISQKCTKTQSITSEWKQQQLMMITDQNQQEQMISNLISRFFLKLYILHSISLLCILLIILYCFIDFVPKQNIDHKYIFHFISIIIVFIVSISTLYASYIAYERPKCLSTNAPICCKVIDSNGFWNSNDDDDKKSHTSININEILMITIMILNLFTSIIMMMTTIIYFYDVRQDAIKCGYLNRVHNENYIVR
ncbi:hypothetical protein DERP_004973 [Dermatophagoides pteronyssinus]|uniref:Uncharacterized protein n=1 Tax=Dermatophagoides pteronyssinus TaxID=6956 RepID=A0ABQ8JTL1_DERPT|nr:hypothetical protein DERP_004973 [Dermatophagoides pteronyssinus]